VVSEPRLAPVEAFERKVERRASPRDVLSAETVGHAHDIPNPTREGAIPARVPYGRIVTLTSHSGPTLAVGTMQMAVVPPPRAERTDRDASPILVVDDDAKIVRLVRTYLEREGFSVVDAADGVAALAAIRERSPRLVVLDLMLPRLDGLAVARAAREGSAVPILILSARSATSDRILGIELGADDYLPKPFSPAELVARVKAILRRTATGDAPTRGTLRQRDLVIDLDRQEVRRGSELIALTAAEFRILVALVRHDGRILDREALIAELSGGPASELMDRTIDVYIRRLRDKLGDDPDHPRYIATVRGAGYRAAPWRSGT
jgi:DNA-binding response OmpR family regulator